jgi:hypothetical protein
MPSIDSSTPFAALIRTRVSCLRKKVVPATEKAVKKPPQTESDLAITLLARIAAIDPDDPQRERKAFDLFLESILISEFGDALCNDPAFYDMAEKIHTQMEADQDVVQHMQMASRMLLERAAQAHPEKR